MTFQNYGRFLPAFILLFLWKKPAYGSELVHDMKESIPHDRSDAPAVYRTLNDLEKKEAVTSRWDTSEKGAPKKIYSITDKGVKLLGEYQLGVEQKKRNMEFFLSQYETLMEREQEAEESKPSKKEHIK
ncbi:MAG: transcriptional regulator, PadR-like family [Oscillospiraceae bacterium]|nr:transcriptional regulator, PadR-like family [Oscillospiraceae bacterium]